MYEYTRLNVAVVCVPGDRQQFDYSNWIKFIESIQSISRFFSTCLFFFF